MKPSPKKSTARAKQRTKSSSNSNNSHTTHQQHPLAAGFNQNSQQAFQSPHQKQTAPHSDSSGNDPKEKTSFKAYAGFSTRSVRTAWEQHDKQETEVSADVYERLAEDTTYKLWELVNNIKTYSRHSSGRVTYDLVNEVLKDSDVPPIVGASCQPWDKIEYDGAYFFNTDEVLDLREEYIKDVTMEQCNVNLLSTTWMAEAEIAEDLIAMHNNVCDAIFLGDEDCFNMAINILRCHPHIPSLMKLLLTKAIEMLGFEYTEDTLRRTLEYLEALVENYHVAHSDLTLELSLLSQLFVNLLLGPVGYVHSKVIPSAADLVGTQTSANMETPVNQQHQQQVLDTISPLFNQSMAMLENNLPSADDSNNSNSNATEELLRSIENIKHGADGMDITIKDEYEALFSMVQGLGKQEEGPVESVTVGANVVDQFQGKPAFDPNTYDTTGTQNYIVQQTQQQSLPHPTPATTTQDGQHAASNSLLTNDMLNSGPLRIEDRAKQEMHPLRPTPILLDADPEENVSQPMSESSDGVEEVFNPNSTTLESENITTLICDDYLVERVCRVVGLCAGKWGFVEQECTFLLVERLHRYFQERKTVSIDMNWLSRVLRGLWAVGEYAFRELLPYFYQIDSQTIPESLVPHFSIVGIFLNGRSDIFFYEYLSDICGDSLEPFLFSYEQFIENLYRKYGRRSLKIIAAKTCYRVEAKVVLKRLPRTNIHSDRKCLMLSECFEELQLKRLPSSSNTMQAPRARFGFRFPGCRPMSTKMTQNYTKALSSTIPATLKQNADLLNTFNSKVVVARRRMLKTATNEPPKRRVFCYGSCPI
ncbi:uncharacterized protein LOC126581122 [Anopheles aquasalis]|uniref:uncharacterized protein LOC126581122 n=1 Tax=Anopheles aquasalis TaxID=42839 RepID=UPI00215B1B77|nr:uncharacterized protein LOC126581122 [Anopheles aquasalis]